MTTTKIRLDNVERPEEVSRAILEAAGLYWASTDPRSIGWTDRPCGPVWGRIAAILEQAAKDIDATIKK